MASIIMPYSGKASPRQKSTKTQLSTSLKTMQLNSLKKKLAQIGLNEKERNEMIMYWLPELEANQQSLVRFALTEELQADNKLQVTPKPDSMLRIYMQIEKVEANPGLPEPQLPEFERKGFAVIEWGGANI